MTPGERFRLINQKVTEQIEKERAVSSQLDQKEKIRQQKRREQMRKYSKTWGKTRPSRSKYILE